ncbi:HAD-IC family P-type ATPase [Patescibacteria group bacterium]|nr:HAD-IC family P-type ATPase [Patescibacteria group bacterium]MBU1728126.1 HAD-IC family P-type ATPase [Patescibacteria group bacterium]
MSNFYSLTVSETFQKLKSNEHGLDKKEAEERLTTFGYNKLAEAKVDSLAVIFVRQFKSPLIYILSFASIILFLMGETTNGYVVLFVLLFNSIIGTIQEGRAQNTLLALKKFIETKATVLRGGREIIIPDIEVVPGDIILLQEGEKIPADARVIFSSNLEVDEAAFTGESVPVYKTSEKLIGDKKLITDQKNMVFKGASIVYGNGRAIVVNTGINTEIGKISKKVATIDTEIPLKKDIRNLSQVLVFVTAGFCIFSFLLGILLGKPIREMFSLVVSLSVSIIPEGLPIVMTLILAAGVWRMSKRNALVKKLQAVEALGQARVIAADKTGTITKNEMMVERVYVGGKFFEIGGVGYEPKGDVRLSGSVVDPTGYPGLLLVGRISIFCANASVFFLEREKLWRVSGDPTDAAMLVLSQKFGFRRDDIEKRSSRVNEIPFDYKLKYHAVIYNYDKQKVLSVAGAPEVILNLSERIWHDGNDSPMGKEERKHLKSIYLSMSQNGLRVIALAESKKVPDKLDSNSVDSLTFVGFLGIQDAIRPEVFDAVQKSTMAGIKVVMITGDNKITAEAIARQAGIYKEGDLVLSGDEIDVLSDRELSKKIAKATVFARVTPEHKLRIIMAYRMRGEIVAMTGDGVNDAPSIVAADLGVAMGKIGTEVTKEASDIVLLDDNLGSIVSAVEEGRNIYKTIKKVLLYLLSTNFGEALVIVCALLLGFPLPILAAQLIWVNLVTDTFLDVSLAMEPKEGSLLSSGFERPKKYLMDKLMLWRMVLMSAPMIIGTLIAFSKYYENDLTKALTISFTTMVVFQWFNAFNCRHESKSVFKMNPFSNKFLIIAIVIVVGLQLLAVYNPFLQKILRTTPLNLSEWIMIILISSSIIFVEEIRKFFYRRKVKLA